MSIGNYLETVGNDTQDVGHDSLEVSIHRASVGYCMERDVPYTETDIQDPQAIGKDPESQENRESRVIPLECRLPGSFQHLPGVRQNPPGDCQRLVSLFHLRVMLRPHAHLKHQYNPKTC